MFFFYLTDIFFFIFIFIFTFSVLLGFCLSFATTFASRFASLLPDLLITNHAGRKVITCVVYLNYAFFYQFIKGRLDYCGILAVIYNL